MRHKIYDKDSLIEKAEVKELEYNGVYEGERYITVKASSPYPVDFKIGDKLTYRGKVFTLDKISSIKRNARNYQSGKSIEYEGLRFLDTASELYDIQFCDYVLNDNNLPYTGLGTFSFYVSKAEDFGSRIQANLDLNYGEGKWKVEYGNSKDINKAKTMSIGSDTNVYDALVQFSNDYDVNFTINEYTITIGFTQEATEYEYFFGKDHGLISLGVTTDASQRIVTRLKAYGSQRNIPYLYYTNLGKEYVVKVKSAQKYTSANVRLVLSVDLGLDFNENDSIFTNGVDTDTNADWRNYKIKVRAGDTEAVAIIECHTSSSLQPANEANIYIGLDYYETDSKIVDKIIEYFEGISSYPTDLYITEGYNSKKVPYENTFIPSGVPNNMSVKNLMLPGFPNESLYDWATRISKENTETGSKVLALINEGFDFSKNQYLPYIISPNVKDYGIKDGEVTFDGSDEDWDEVYPSLEGMTVNELSTISGYEGSITFKGEGEVDRILSGSSINDNGVSSDGTYGDGSKDTGGVLMYASFEITIPNIGFNLWDYRADGETPVIHMQDGMCAGRSFEILKCIPVNADDITKGYRLNLQRELDQSVNMYYPNKIYNISAGDKFVLEGIEMPDVYIEAASVRLLFQSIEKLRDIDYLKTKYKPEIDNIFMARNPKYAENLYEGIKMCIADDDLGIVAITISQLNIKETEGEIPKYEVTLDDESTAELLSLNTATGNVTETQQSTGQSIKLIKTNDDTTPTNRNAFSALRSLEEFLNKNSEDTAQEKIHFLKGADFGEYKTGRSGAIVDENGNAEWLTAVIRELLRSLKFVDGLTGEGWQIWIDTLTGLSNLTIDKVTIRQALVAMELLIQKVRSIGGQFVVSAANGKIKTITKEGDNYKITFEQNNDFVAHDLMRCAEFTDTSSRGYWVEISDSDGEGITVPISEFSGVEPKVGDECVLMGNTQDRLRQNLISIAATEDGQPRIDVLDKVNAKHFNGCLRVRIGCLDGISDSSFPANNQPQGYGLYGDNVYLKGTFLLTTGEDILTKFNITEGKIESAVERLRKDISEEKSYLANSSFSDGLSKWETEANALLFMRAGKWLLANGAPLAKKSDYATVKTDSGRTTLYINNKYILQKNENFRYHPDFEENDEGIKKAEPVYISFFYRVAKKGTLSISFENVDESDFENFNSLGYSEVMDITDGYQTFSTSLVWNGTGDFKLAFTGEIYIYMLVLSTDRADALAYRYRTLFEQSDTLVRIVAENFDKDGNVIESSSIITNAKYNKLMSQYFDEDGRLIQTAGLVTSAEMNKLYAFDANGNLVSMIEQTAVDIKISAENISFEGHVVTANGNFKILEDGSVEANGNFVSKDDEYGNSIIINASSGSFKMIGPSAVDADGLPANDNRKDLYALEFLTDTESSRRYASIKLWGDDVLTINPYNGFYLVNPLGKAYCHLTKESLEFRNEEGEYAVFDITGYHK